MRALPVDLDELDPGIRRVVALLNSRGWVTTDSGDGVTKEPGPDVIPMPHVVIAPAASHRWADILKADILPFITPEAAERLYVEFSYSTRDQHGILIAFGITDADLIA